MKNDTNAERFEQIYAAGGLRCVTEPMSIDEKKEYWHWKKRRSNRLGRDAYRAKYTNNPDYMQRRYTAARLRYATDPEYRAKKLANVRNRPNKKEKLFMSDLKRRYNLSVTEREALFAKQNYRCGICKIDVSGGRGWCTDHIKGTKVVRGILCHHCNLMLGFGKDSPEVLREGAMWVERGLRHWAANEKTT